MKRFIALVLALGLSNGLGAQSLPEYSAHRAVSAPVIDGDLGDPAWAAATVAPLGFPWPGQTGKHQATRVRLLWDDQRLYFAFDCDDTDLTATHEHRDDPTYEDDAAEIFLNPFPDRTEYVGLEINARGVLYDYLFVHPQKLYPNYDLKGVRLAATQHGGANPGWTIEASVPLDNFVDKWDKAPVQEGTVWTMNLSRWDGTEPQRAFSIWSDPGLRNPDPHAPARFGRLRFSL
jgi:hypothetical protein